MRDTRLAYILRGTSSAGAFASASFIKFKYKLLKQNVRQGCVYIIATERCVGLLWLDEASVFEKNTLLIPCLSLRQDFFCAQDSAEVVGCCSGGPIFALSCVYIACRWTERRLFRTESHFVVLTANAFFGGSLESGSILILLHEVLAFCKPQYHFGLQIWRSSEQA